MPLVMTCNSDLSMLSPALRLAGDSKAQYPMTTSTSEEVNELNSQVSDEEQDHHHSADEHASRSVVDQDHDDDVVVDNDVASSCSVPTGWIVDVPVASDPSECQLLEEREDTKEMIRRHGLLKSDLLICGNMATLQRSPSSILKKSFDHSDELIPINIKRSCWKQLPPPDITKLQQQRSSLSIVESTTSSKASLYTVLTSGTNSCHSSTGRGCRVQERDSNNKKKDDVQGGGSVVRFAMIHVRAFEQTLGDNPSVSIGPPVTLDWSYEEMEPIDIDSYEEGRGPRRCLRQMMLNYYNRRNLLTWCCGISEEEIRQAERLVYRTQWQRSVTKALLPTQKIQEVVQSAVRKSKRIAERKNRSY